MSGVCCNRRRKSDGRLWTPGGQLVALCGGCGPGVWAPTGRERLEKCAHSVVARGPEAADGWRGAAWAPGLRRRGGAFLADKRGYCRWARGWWGPYIGWSRVLDPDCAHFHSRIAKIFLGFWRREREGGLRVRENALNEGHQACRTTSRLMMALAPEVSHRPSSKDAITGSIPSATTFKSRDIHLPSDWDLARLPNKSFVS